MDEDKEITQFLQSVNDFQIQVPKRAIYQFLSELSELSEANASERKLTLQKDFEAKRYCWDHPMYDEYHSKTKERDEYLLNPIKVEEGLFTCDNCGSKRTYSFAKQTRGGDEKTTIFVSCANLHDCGKQWRI